MVEAYKAQFIDFLLSRNVLKVGGPFELKSKRLSPYFLKLDDVNDGEGLLTLGDAYASAILANLKPEDFDGVTGIPKKAHVFGPGVSAALARRGANKTYSSWRDVPKTYGDATALGADEQEQRQKEYVLGARIPNGSRQVLVDDVMTAGDAKEGALEMLKFLAQDVIVPALVIAANRQEIDEYGESAIAEFTRKHNIPIFYPITAGDIFDYLKETGRISPEDERAFTAYLRAWGTSEVREKYGLVSKPLIDGRTVIPACDLDSVERFEEVVKATADHPKIGGYKIGFELGYLFSLPRLSEIARQHAPNKKLILDHQKAGSDIGDVQFGRKFANVAKRSGFDAVIIFPQSGPVTQTAWTGEALQAGVEVIVGGMMTHKGYLARDRGYIRDDAPEEMYRRAARHGIRNFVVPGNNPDAVAYYRGVISSEGVDPVLFAPGFITQNGKISEAGKAAGENFHPIVGRDIMNAKNIRSKVDELTAELAA